MATTTFNNEEKIVMIDNYWSTGMIPAILRNAECMFPESSEVWIPDGYESGGGGFSTRVTRTIQEFNGSEEIKNDILTKWKNVKIAQKL
jgi:hypothetical protein